MFNANLFENPRGLLQMYHNFIEKVTGAKRKKKISVALAIDKSTDATNGEESIIPLHGEISLVSRNLSLRSEAILFLFEIERTAKNLFLFCVATKMNPETLEFRWTMKDIIDFQDFCGLFGKAPSESTVKDAMKALVSQNLVRSLQRSKYMCNPIIISTSENLTTGVFGKYTNNIIEKEAKTGKLGGLIQEKLFPKQKYSI